MEYIWLCLGTHNPGGGALLGGSKAPDWYVRPLEAIVQESGNFSLRQLPGDAPDKEAQGG
eukprot:1580161-Amphidinium_carterae.1